MDAIGTLVQERAGLLAGPGGGEVSDGSFPDLHTFRDASPGELHVLAQRFVPAHRRVVPEEDAVRFQDLTHRGEDVAPHGFEAGGEELHDNPAVVPVHDERGERVAFSVHHAVGTRVDAGAPGQRPTEPLHPPCRIDRSRRGLEQPEGDLRRG